MCEEKATPDPAMVFLTREQLGERHGFSRSAGYKWVQRLVTQDPTFPQPIANRWRLDHVMAWEDHHALEGLRTARREAEQHSVMETPAAEPPPRGPGRPRRQEA